MRKPERASKKTVSQSLRSNGTNWWKTQKRALDGTLSESQKVSNRILPKINQLLLDEDYNVRTVDVIRVKLIDGVMHGYAKLHGQGNRKVKQSIGNTWVFE